MTGSFAETLAQARGGDSDAFEELISPQLGPLTAYVRLRLNDQVARRESTADIVQSVCREVLLDLGTMRATTEAGFRAWLYGVVANKLADKHDFHRAARRDVGREISPGQRVPGDVPLLEVYGRVATPSRDVAAQEELARIEAAFDELPEHYRDVLLMVSIAGLSYAETATATGRSEDSVRQVTHRARARLATLLDT